MYYQHCNCIDLFETYRENNIFEIGENEFSKYNQSILSEISITQTGVETIRHATSLHRASPQFVMDALTFDFHPPQRKIHNLFPETVCWNSEGDFFLGVNGGHCNGYSTTSPKNFKNMDGGFALVGWYIHPYELKKTIFVQKDYRDDYSLALKQHKKVPYDNRVWGTRKKREKNKPSNLWLTESYGFAYPATLLDLDSNWLDWLFKIRSLILRTLNDTYQIAPTDIVDIYFHDLYVEYCSTLHVHVRVNKPAHPLDEACRIRLDDVIHEITAYGNCHRLYTNNKMYKRCNTVADSRIFGSGKGINVKSVLNRRFWMDCPHIVSAAGLPFAAHVFSS